MATRGAGPLAAFVLHGYDWSESSLVLDVFTREQGRVAVVAKGAKKPHSNFRAVLLPFQRLLVGIGRAPAREGEPPGEVHTLRGAEWAGGHAMLSGAALFAGFYLNELLMKLLPREDPHPALFDAYADTLPHLADAEDARVQQALRAFELLLLKESGLLPELDVVTATQRPAEPARLYALRAEAGLVEVHDDGLPGAALPALQAALDAGDAAALREACGAALGPLKVQLRSLLHYHLGTTMLRTRQLMLDVQNLR